MFSPLYSESTYILMDVSWVRVSCSICCHLMPGPECQRPASGAKQPMAGDRPYHSLFPIQLLMY